MDKIEAVEKMEKYCDEDILISSLAVASEEQKVEEYKLEDCEEYQVTPLAVGDAHVAVAIDKGTHVATEMGSFLSVNHGMNWGALQDMRSLHAALPVWAFLWMYLHIMRNMMRSIFSQTVTQASGAVLLVMGYAVAFLGYAMVYGDMGYWATNVIFGLLDCIPQCLMTLFGDFSLGYTAVTKLFTLHYLLGIVYFVLMFWHILCLHTAGSWQILATSKEISFWDTMAKDGVIILGVIWMIMVSTVSASAIYMVHGENDIYPINLDATPAHIVPEAYLLSVYGGLKSVANKATGIAAAAVLLGSLFMH